MSEQVESYEIKASIHYDPDQKSGQHTNGPANLFVRKDGSSPWYFVNELKCKSQVRRMIEQLGFEEFVNRWGVTVVPRPVVLPVES